MGPGSRWVGKVGIVRGSRGELLQLICRRRSATCRVHERACSVSDRDALFTTKISQPRRIRAASVTSIIVRDDMIGARVQTKRQL